MRSADESGAENPGVEATCRIRYSRGQPLEFFYAIALNPDEWTPIGRAPLCVKITTLPSEVVYRIDGDEHPLESGQMVVGEGGIEARSLDHPSSVVTSPRASAATLDAVSLGPQHQHTDYDLMKRILLLLALLPFASPALAQTKPLPNGEIRANGDIMFGNALKLGRKENGRTFLTPDAFRSTGIGPDDLTYASTPNPDAVQISPGMGVMFCPGLACIPGITDRNQRASMAISGKTRFDGEAEEQLLGLSMTTKTGKLTNWSANTAYVTNQNIVGSGDNVYRVASNCTSGASMPVLPDQNNPKGAVVQNGTCSLKWINRGAIAAKVTAYFENEVEAGAGNAWTQANNYIMRTGAPRNFMVNTEMDFSNISGADCQLGEYCTALRIGMGGPNKASMGIDITSDGTPGKKTIWALSINGDNLASDNLIGLDSSTKVGIGSNVANLHKPTFSEAFIRDDSIGGPTAFANSSMKTAAVFDEYGGGAWGYQARGTYTQAAINTQAANITPQGGSPTALVASPGQQVCYAGFNVCWRFDQTASKMMLRWNGADVFSIDGSGNVRAASFTQGAP